MRHVQQPPLLRASGLDMLCCWCGVSGELSPFVSRPKKILPGVRRMSSINVTGNIELFSCSSRHLMFPQCWVKFLGVPVSAILSKTTQAQGGVRRLGKKVEPGPRKEGRGVRIEALHCDH